MKDTDKETTPTDTRDRRNDKCASISRKTWFQTQFAQNITGQTRKDIYAEAIEDWLRKKGINKKVAKLVSAREKAA